MHHLICFFLIPSVKRFHGMAACNKVMQEKDLVIDYITLWYKILAIVVLSTDRLIRGVPTLACYMEKNVLRVLVRYSIFTSYHIRNPTVTLPLIIAIDQHCPLFNAE